VHAHAHVHVHVHAIEQIWNHRHHDGDNLAQQSDKELECSVRFAGLFAGLKLVGHSPARCQARMPRKKK